MQINYDQKEEQVKPVIAGALIFRPDPSDNSNQEEVIEHEIQTEVQPEVETQITNEEEVLRKSKQERKQERKEFSKNKKTNEKGKIERNYDLSSALQSPHVEHDSARLRRWMSEDLEKIKQYIDFCRNPPISDDPEENHRIELSVDKYIEKTLFNDAHKIADYIEGLEFHGVTNPDLFGDFNYLLNETIEGYKSVYEKICALKGKNQPEEALRLLYKLVIIALRPLREDEGVSKSKILEQSIVATNVKV